MCAGRPHCGICNETTAIAGGQLDALCSVAVGCLTFCGVCAFLSMGSLCVVPHHTGCVQCSVWTERVVTRGNMCCGFGRLSEEMALPGRFKGVHK